MTFLKFGTKGINVESIASWSARQQQRTNEQSRTNENVDLLTVKFIGGSAEAYEGEDAAALRKWLEGNAQNLLLSSQMGFPDEHNAEG